MLAQHAKSYSVPCLPGVGDVINDRYCVLDELGRGGMGSVLAAHDAWLNRDVALKILLPRWAQLREAVRRFTSEARNLARLDSPHVVRVMDYGSMRTPTKSAGLPFMVLELLRGEDLYNVAQQGRLEPARVVRYALEACAGLAAAHALGIVHRDLKPENLFLAIEADGSECLKVLDFGIARSRKRTATRGGTGSPGYMAPEQVRGTTALGAQTDIWALGVVMYELLTQRPAFEGNTPEALCAQTLTAPVVPLREVRPDLPAELVYVVERCLERLPERRFVNVAELALALTAALGALQGTPELEPQEARRSPEDAAQAATLVVKADCLEEPKPPVDDGSRNASSSSNRAAFELIPSIPRHAQRRRLWARSLATAIFVPALVVLPCAAAAPELSVVRAWSLRASGIARENWRELLRGTRALWQQPEPAPPTATAH